MKMSLALALFALPALVFAAPFAVFNFSNYPPTSAVGSDYLQTFYWTNNSIPAFVPSPWGTAANITVNDTSAYLYRGFFNSTFHPSRYSKNFTVRFKVKLTNNTDVSQTILQASDAGDATTRNDIWAIGIESYGAGSTWFTAYGQKATDCLTSPSIWYTYNSMPVNDSDWYDIEFTYDGNTPLLYVNNNSQSAFDTGNYTEGLTDCGEGFLGLGIGFAVNDTNGTDPAFVKNDNANGRATNFIIDELEFYNYSTTPPFPDVFIAPTPTPTPTPSPSPTPTRGYIRHYTGGDVGNIGIDFVGGFMRTLAGNGGAVGQAVVLIVVAGAIAAIGLGLGKLTGAFKSG